MAKSRSGGKYTRKKYMSTLERNTPEYKLWRLSVYKRDGYKCKKCGKRLTKGRKLQAHHIFRWSDFPSLRYDVGNGITLCWECHKQMQKNEESYVSLCKMLIGDMKAFIKMKNMIQELIKEEEKEDDEEN